MINLRIKTTRGIAIALMFALWAIGHAMAIAGLQALDQGHWVQLMLYSAAGSGSLWGSWLCWRFWCWKSQCRPMANYRLERRA